MKSLDECLTQDHGGKFADKSWLFGLLGAFRYTPTGEKMDVGFRHFATDAATVLAAFERRDVNALLALPFALDDEGDADTSAVLVTMRYTPTGSAIALQVEEYVEGDPRPRSEVWLLEGAAGQAVIAQITKLDQSA
jgi:hypothetical protein